MKTADAQGHTYILWQGNLARVIGHNMGHKTVMMEMLTDEGRSQCENCGHPQPTQVEIIEASPLFQNNAEAVTTLEESD